MSHHCEKAQALAHRYIDGEVVWLRRVQIRWHLRRCPPCEEGFHFEAWFKQRVHDGCREDIPTVVYERLRAVLREYPLEGPPAG